VFYFIAIGKVNNINVREQGLLLLESIEQHTHTHHVSNGNTFSEIKVFPSKWKHILWIMFIRIDVFFFFLNFLLATKIKHLIKYINNFNVFQTVR